jgi:hypothetical protein
MGKPSISKEPSRDRVTEVLDYDASTGVFRWKIINSNRTKIGSVAGSIAKSPRGPYRVIGIDGVKYRASALAVMCVTGVWPTELVDHRNHNTLDDRFDNVRPATYQENSFNTGAHVDNATGLKGVHLHVDGRYRAQISVNRKRAHLGLFATASQAHQAYLAAAERLHGEFFYGGDNRKA